MVDYFDFQVGVNEVHKIQYHNEYGGHHIVVSVDGDIISGERSFPLIPSNYKVLRKGNELKFMVGDQEVHEIKLIFHTGGKLGIIMGCDVTVEIDGRPFRTFKESGKGILD